MFLIAAAGEAEDLPVIQRSLWAAATSTCHAPPSCIVLVEYTIFGMSPQVGHQDFVWQIRKDPRITRVFEALWGTSALLSSFDRCADRPMLRAVLPQCFAPCNGASTGMKR